MEKRGVSQEGLKLIACVTMLIDHIGAALVPWWSLRIIGRIAFPIYCFLLAEGEHYTRNSKKYALRLMVGMLLSELPFDLALFGGWTWWYQSVMVTLLLGFFALRTMGKCSNLPLKLLVSVPFVLGADLLMTDYGGAGVLLIVLFGITRELPRRWVWQMLGMGLICGCLMPSAAVEIFGYPVSVEIFALAALPLIGCYQGRKASGSKGLQWAFYLFYPVHLWLLYGIQQWILR